MDVGGRHDFEEFVRGRSTALLRTAYLLTGDRGHAEDLLQGVFERVSRRWPSVGDAPEAYVRRALTNAATNRWRRRRLHEVALTDVHQPTSEPAEHQLALRDELMRGLMSLPPRQRAVLVLRFFEDMTEAETAAAMGCSIGTVKSQASRGLDRLRALVGDNDDQSAVGARSER